MLNYLLLLYTVIYFIAAFLWRSLLVRRATGINPYKLENDDSPHGFVGLLFRLTIFLLAGMVLVNAIFESAAPYLIPIFWLQHPVLVIVGFTLLIISLIWTVVAQAQMGHSWRIGLDKQHKTELVQHGVFRLTRNPIFLGMQIWLLGFLFVLPNAFSLLTLGLGFTLINIQVRLEEEFLTQLHGDVYKNYCRQVRRWL